MDEIKHIKIDKDMKVSELVEGMKNMGFQARKISEAAQIFKEMIQDKDCKIFFGLAGAMIPAGMKNILIDMLNKGCIDVFVTTGANLTHDLIEALGNKHYKGNHLANDEELRERKIDRIYDVYLEDKVYEDLEKFFEKIYPDISKKEMNIKEFLWEIGKNLGEAGKNSVLRVCYEKRIPIFCPAISDSGIGLMIWGRLVQKRDIQGKLSKKNLKVDVFDDLKEILDIAWTCKKAGVFYVGGGVPKNFIQQAMQFSNKQGANYGVQITTDRPEAGGSSGAPLKEGISWGKMSKKGKHVNVFCDATIALPLIYAAIKI